MNDVEKETLHRAAGIFEGMMRPWLDETRGKPSGYRVLDDYKDEGLSDALQSLSERGMLIWDGPECEAFAPSERAVEVWRKEVDLGEVLGIDMEQLSPSGTEALASRLLHTLGTLGVKRGDPRRGRHNVRGASLRRALAIRHGVLASPEQINDAVDLLESNGYVKTHSALGTAPYAFRGVEPTPRGRLEVEKMYERSRANTSAPTSAGTKVFIGHGHSHAWRALKDFLREELQLHVDEFNREPTAGLSTKERLQRMLNDAAFAFLVMTAEEETPDGARRARANVIHEAGLFQGRLGFERAIVLLEDGCDEFSNITGLGQIRFPPGRIEAAFEEVRQVLKREGLSK